MKKNRLSTYLIYAFGEIVLVVAGILIALQVNDWNDRRKERNEEKRILISIAKDLDITIKEFEFLNGLREKAINASYRIFEVSKDYNNYNRVELDSLFANISLQPTYNGTLGTLDLLFSTGKINLISNQELKDRLIGWPGIIDDLVEEEVYAYDMYRDYLYKELSNYNVIAGIVNSATVGGSIIVDTLIHQPVHYLGSSEPSEYADVLQNKILLNHIAIRNGHFEVLYTETVSVIKWTHEIKSIVEEEIRKLE